MRDVAPDLHVPEEAKARPSGDLLEGTRDRLELRVIGRDTQANEPQGVGSRSIMSTSTRGSSLASSAPAA